MSELKTASIETLTAEIKFYLQKTAENVVEIGKRLILAKELVEYGEWQSWLQNNFQLTYRSAKNFMDVAERFGKSEIDFTFKPTQLIAMLALPAGDEEKFIAEKSVEGTPVEDMTVKKLREEIKSWKKQAEDAKTDSAAEIERLEKIRLSLNDALTDNRKTIDGLIIEKNFLEKQLKERPTKKIETEVPPKDYLPTKTENIELKAKIADKESELQAALKNISDLQAKLKNVNKTVEKLKKSN